MRRAKNVILFIGDGNGITSNYVNRLFIGQMKGEVGEKYMQVHEQFPYLGLIKTYNSNAQMPDSAGTSTALHSGGKTREGLIGVDETLICGECDNVASSVVDVSSDIFTEMGKSVGIVSTARITHATPASVYAHSADRGYENNSEKPKDCRYPDIAQQLIKKLEMGKVDVALGGAAVHFVSENEKIHSRSGRRTDGLNLIRDAQAHGVVYVSTAQQLRNAVNGIATSSLLGLFSSSHMAYEEDRLKQQKSEREPSLADMSEAAITVLEKNKQGYFLSIEAGRIDHAHHAAQDGLAFAQAIERVMKKVDTKDTLVIVTADHAHGLALSGVCGLYSPITALCYRVDSAGSVHSSEPNLAKDGKPYTVAGYITGTEESSVIGKTDERDDLTNEQVMDPDYHQESLIPLNYEEHGGQDVAVYAIGPWAHLLTGTIEQNFIFNVMMHAVGR